MNCVCGNNEFYAHQQLWADIIVDGDNDFVRNLDGGLIDAINEYSEPYGDYTCTKCGKTYSELR